MKSHIASIGVVLAIVAGLSVNGVFAQQAPVKRNFDAEIQAALQSAKTAAGFEFLGTLVRTCLLPQSGGENTSDNVPGYVTNPASAPARDTWYAEPAKVFDNLYFVGGKLHSSWALTTSEGIILFDTIYPYNSEELIVGGMKKLGLDPKNIKYVLISHAHGDHIGGAEMLQTRYGARVVMGGPDWDLVAKYPNRYKTMAPKRDIVATDGMKITLGDTTVTIWLTPGHTPGTLSYTFTVLDRGKPVNVAYSGGTAFNFVNNTPDPGIRNFQTYIESQQHMAAEGRRHRRDRPPLEPLGVRQCGQQEQNARRARRRSASIRARGRLRSSAISRSCRVARGRRSSGWNRNWLKQPCRRWIFGEYACSAQEKTSDLLDLATFHFGAECMRCGTWFFACLTPSRISAQILTTALPSSPVTGGSVLVSMLL